MNPAAKPDAEQRWYLISLRPVNAHASMRRAAARVGAQVLALSPWRLLQHTDTATRAQLALALAADRVVFTSPAAVDAAAALTPLAGAHHGRWLAVGAGSAAALQRHGARGISAPERMDSEGLLALPALAALQGLRAGLVTAPGGRGIIAQTLQDRGAQLIRANVYERVAIPLPSASVRRLAALDAPAVLALSSGEALAQVLQQLPTALLQRLQGYPAVAAGPRLAALAEQAGFRDVHSAAGPLPAQLAEAASAVVTRPRPD